MLLPNFTRKQTIGAKLMLDPNKTWVGSLITFTGLTFDIRRPQPSMVTMLDIGHALSMQCRFNGHIPTFYSVAEHSVRVAQKLYDWEEPNEVVLLGLLHDSAEAYLGDMISPMKQMPTLGPSYKALERSVEEVIGEKFNLDLVNAPKSVKEADDEVYLWELDNIRSGAMSGWPSKFARDEFLNHYFAYGGNYYGR
jgi:hypothetical protein